MRASRYVVMAVAAVIAVTPAIGASAQAPSADGAPSTLAARVLAALDQTIDGLDYDVDAERAWVREAVAHRPYQGVVQGALGSFLTRTGNDVDQALLLAAMLERSTVGYRFASCAASPSAPPEVLPSDDLPGQQVVSALAASIDDPELRSAVLAVPTVMDEARTTTDAVGTRLLGVLETLDTGPTEASAPASPAASAMPAAGTHVWVQARTGVDWRDLDTTTPTGAPPCLPDWTGGTLPARLEGHLGVALEVETIHDGQATSSTALDADVPLWSAMLSPITFAFGSPTAIGGTIADVLGGSAQYTPVLVAGDRVVTGSPIELTAPGGGGLDEVFGGDDGSATAVSAAWLRLTLATPDGATTVRSELFDRIGPAAREAGEAGSAPMRDLQVVDGEYADLAAVWELAVLPGEMRVPEVATDVSAALDPGVATAAPLDSALRLYPSLVRRLGGDPSGPMLILAGVIPDRQAGTDPGTRLVLDALHVPGTPPASRAAATREAAAIVGAERTLLTLLGLEPQPLGDAASVLETADAASIPWVELAPGDDPSIEGASPDALARIRARLASGDRILTPTRVPTVGDRQATAWWVIDPVTGLIRDEHESGRHMAEYAKTNEPVPSWAERMRAVACRAVGPAIVAASLLFAVTGGDPNVGSLLGKVAKAGQMAEENRKKGEQARKIACLGSGGSGA
ncbi:MAG: hypothetical protein U0667_04780 [Chloroflexota bacterium]